MVDLPVPKNGQFIGECIYCGATGELKTEHAVPYAVNGSWTLLKASCAACEKITHRFERDTLRGLYGPLRTVFKMQTRRPKNRAATLPLLIETRGHQRVVEVPLDEYPLLLPVIAFPPPGVVAGRPVSAPVPMPVLDVRHLSGPPMAEVRANYPGADYVGVRIAFAPEDFGRTLAKIAFCAGVFSLGLAPLRSSPLRAVVLGVDKDVWHWVGSWTGAEKNPPQGLHGIRLSPGNDGNLHAWVRLFGQFGAPEYHVVLGPLDRSLVAAARWPEEWNRPFEPSN